MSDPYSQGLPCLNPHCKSQGRPHPNCRCYGFAEGGEVSSFCSQNKEHEKGCEYFSGGGITANSDSLPTADQVDDPLPQASDVDDPLPTADQVHDAKDYGTPIQQGITAAEGFAKGQLPFVAPWLETKLGVPVEDIKGRAETNPIESTGSQVAGFLTPSPVNLLGKIGGAAAGAAEALGIAGAAGRLALKGAVEAAGLVASDEATKALLGSPGSDPEHPVGMALLNMTAAGALGGALGPMGELAGDAITAAAKNKAVSNIVQKLLVSLPEKIITTEGAADIIAGKGAYAAGAKGIPLQVSFPIIKKFVQPAVDSINKILGNPIGKASEYTTDAVLKAIVTNSESNLPQVLHYVNNVGQGVKKVAPAISRIFSTGSAQLFSPASDPAKEKIKDWIKGGGIDSEMQQQQQNQQQENATPAFAEGGKVPPAVPQQPVVSRGVGDTYPEQNILLNAAKGRVSGYLNSLRPLPNQQKLPFDDDMKDKEKSRQYDKAVDLAANPLTILNHVNQGTLTPDHMKHFSSMFPESYRVLSKEMTKQIMDSQLKGKKPPYGKRLAMSLFLGTNLDSTLTPLAVQTIQGLYAQNKMQAQQQMATQGQSKPKKSAINAEKAANPYLTDDQARIKRQQSSKA